MPRVGETPKPGLVVKVRRMTGHYVYAHEPILDLLVDGNIVTILAPEAGKILTSRVVGDVVKPNDLVAEVTGVGTPTQDLFIAYRQADSAGHAGRLADRLIADFGKGQVFKDVESLPPGVDFEDVIREMLRRASAMIVVVGPQWLSLSNSKGPRIQDPGDLHREEIRTAVERGIPLFPTLVNRAAMPTKDQLPDDISALATRYATEISDRRWDHDMGTLSAAVGEALAQSPRRRAFLDQLKSREEFGNRGLQWITDDPLSPIRQT